MRVLVTGHRGYIGGRLVPMLLDRGHVMGPVAQHRRGRHRHVCSGQEQLGRIEPRVDARRRGHRDRQPPAPRRPARRHR